MRRLVVVCMLLGLLLVACGDESNGGDTEDAEVRSAFVVWDVATDDVPVYEISNTLTDDPGGLLSVETLEDDWDEFETKQVMADIIESNRGDYSGVIVRALDDGDGDEFTGIYAETEDILREIAPDYDLDVNQANDAGYPLLVFQR